MTRSKNYFYFCLFRVKIIFQSENLAGLAHSGALEICLFRAEFFIHRIASQNVHRGKFLDMKVSVDSGAAGLRKYFFGFCLFEQIGRG